MYRFVHMSLYYILRNQRGIGPIQFAFSRVYVKSVVQSIALDIGLLIRLEEKLHHITLGRHGTTVAVSKHNTHTPWKAVSWYSSSNEQLPAC